jgi:hypothetical protein
VEGKFQHQSPDFQKARDANPKQRRVACSHHRAEKTNITVKNYQRLGYISYDATTSTWVTFSYELTGASGYRLAVIESVLILKRSNLMADAVKNWPQSSAQVAGSGVGWSWCDAPNYAAGSADRTRNVSETGEAMTGRRLGGEARGGPKRQMRFPSKKVL